MNKFLTIAKILRIAQGVALGMAAAALVTKGVRVVKRLRDVMA